MPGYLLQIGSDMEIKKHPWLFDFNPCSILKMGGFLSFHFEN